MFAALILRTFQIVLLRHRDQILILRFRARPVTINAIPRRRVPAEDKENPPREPRKAGLVGRSLGSGNFQLISLRSRQRSLTLQI
jgi:hypothetical protein